jgi:hypothetical protein
MTDENPNQKINVNKLYQLVTQHFSQEEVKGLCFALDIDHEIIPPIGKFHYTRELINLIKRHNRLTEFLQKCREERPSVEWEVVLEEGNPSKFLIRSPIILTTIILVIIILAAAFASIYQGRSSCQNLIIEFRVSSQTIQDIYALPGSRHQSLPNETLLIRALINGSEIDLQNQFVCTWSYAGAGRITAESGCSVQLRTAPTLTESILTLNVHERNCTGSTVETLRLTTINLNE